MISSHCKYKAEVQLLSKKHGPTHTRTCTAVMCVCLRLQQAWQQVYRLALHCFNTASVTSACVCFCELLGLCSLKLRVDVRVLNTILQHWNQHDTQRTQTEHLHTLGKQTHTYTHKYKFIHTVSTHTDLPFFSVSKGAKLLQGEAGAAEELIGYLETAVIDHLEQKGLNR